MVIDDWFDWVCALVWVVGCFNALSTTASFIDIIIIKLVASAFFPVHIVGYAIRAYYLILPFLETSQMVNTRINCNSQGSNTNQNQLMHVVLQTLQHLQPNPQQQQQARPPPQSMLDEFLSTHPSTFSQAKDPMDAEDWLKSLEKRLEIAQCSDREKVLFAAHQLFGTTADWWETYCNTHRNVEGITWNEFKAHFRTPYIPHGTLKLKKEFSDLNQGSMTVNEYLN
jgi:hypothetical protein